MKRILNTLVLLAIILVVVPARAASTIIAQERFRGASDLTSTNVGAFSAVYGTIHTWRVGPELTTDSPQDDGRHADFPVSVATGAYHNLTSPANAAFKYEFWYWTGEFNSGGFSSIMKTGINFGGSAPWYNEMWALYRKPDGTYLFKAPNETDATIAETAIPRHTWIRFYLYAINLGGFQWTFREGYQPVGGSEVDVYNRVNATETNIGHIDVVGIANDQSGVKYSFAVGMDTLSQITSAADFGPASNVVQPVNAGKAWYVSSTASSAGDGTSGSPLTTTQLATALGGSGILGNAAGTGAGYGDHVIFINDGIYQAPNIWASIRQRGLWLDGNNVTLNFLKTVTGTWTQPDASGAPNVWAIANSEITLVTSAVPVVFENGNGQTAETGANFAAVESALNTTAGSYWSDGTTLYVHPYGNTNPNSDGKTYQRTTASPQECGIQFSGQDQEITNFTIIGTAYYNNTTIGSIGGIAVSDSGGATGRSGGLIQNVSAYLWGKHGFSFTCSTNSGVTLTNCIAERGWPFGFGSQTALVNYADSGTQTATLNYVTARQAQISWAVGPNSAGQGQSTVAGFPYLSHTNTATGTLFSLITFNHCRFGGGNVALESIDAAATFNSCDSCNFNGYAGTVTITGSTSASASSSVHSWLSY